MKQVIVMRKDLNMRKGKMISQGGHAVMGIMFMLLGSESWKGSLPQTETLAQWASNGTMKITVSVNSEEDLDLIVAKAIEAKLPVYLVTDAGHTEFKGVPTKTCCAIGPADAEAVNLITGNLPLL
jgi:PTH2 family peptidyl-tRNA hydrolase